MAAAACRFGAPRRLARIVPGESLCNDGTALDVFATALEVVTVQP